MNAQLVKLGKLILGTKEFHDKERSESLFLFCNKRDLAPRWYDRLPDQQKQLWAEVRADIVVGIARAYEALSMTQEELDSYFFGKRPTFEWEELEKLALELIGQEPNLSDKRWLAGVQERLDISLKSKGVPWTKSHAREVCSGLLSEKGYYRDAYIEMARQALEMGV